MASDNYEHVLVVSAVLFIALLSICIVVGHLFAGCRWLNDSVIAMNIGIFAGAITYLIGVSSSLDFNEQLFFIYLLPPIIFNAGFQVKKKQFFQNFGTIMMFGIVGVFVSCAIISSGCAFLLPKFSFGIGLTLKDFLALGIIFSATDTVSTLQVLHQDETPLLYSIVFGEGVVNDATSIVLFRAVQRYGVTELKWETSFHMLKDFAYLFSFSTALGVGTGLLSAYIMKSLYIGRHSTDREISLMALMAYLSYMLAELFELSGILSVFFCGIIMSHYTWHNISESSKTTTKHVFATMSYIAESFMFLYVGIDVLDMEKWRLADKGAAWLISILFLVLIALGRAAFVFLFSALSNCSRGVLRITFRHQIIIWWAGLMRGAVSIALAFLHFGKANNEEDATMICSTIGVVLFATAVLGMMTKPLIEKLLPHQMRLHLSSPKDDYPQSSLLRELIITGDQIDGDGDVDEDEAILEMRKKRLRRSSLTLLFQDPTSTVHHLWYSFDITYMRPIFGGI